VTTPEQSSTGPDEPPEGGVLGSAKSSPDDVASGGAAPGAAGGAAGPTWPPAETEPDARRRRGSALRGLLDRLLPGRRG
jgi:hypothetical protein